MLRIIQTIWKNFGNMVTIDKDMSVMKRIGTHSGCFHCDEALACFMLKQLPEYRDSEIIRSRDKEVLDTCDIVVDVGGEYNPATHRYDHHQKSFNHTLSTVCPDLVTDKKIKLSSAGLIYAHFGLDVITEVLKKRDLEVNKGDLLKLFAKFYNDLIEEIDALDNGVPMFPPGIKPLYTISTHLGSRVHRLNPEWNTKDKANIDELFLKAVNLVGTEFVDKLMNLVTVWLPARQIVKEALDSRHKVHSFGQILEIKHCPWKYHLHELEIEMDIENEIKFVIFKDTAAQSWRVQTVPLEADSFISRIFLHKDWQGIRDEELSKIANIDGCVFCHSTGFIGGNKTREGAIEMAVKSIEAHETINGD